MMKRRFLLLAVTFLMAVMIPAAGVSAAPRTMSDGTVFDAEFYAASYPDVVAAFGNNADIMYVHYVLFGKAEGRLAVAPGTSAPSGSSSSFDAAYYAARYPDVANCLGYDPAILKLHYDLYGKNEGRFANAAEEAAAAASSVPVPAPAPAPVQTTASTDNSFEMQVLNLCNAQRAAYGLAPLSWDASNLAPGAAVRAQEITAVFSHTRPDGTSCFTAVRNPGRLGENIAAGQRTPEEVVEDWMNSPGHRANILNVNFTKLGVGHVYVAGDMYGHYWVQMFSS